MCNILHHYLHNLLIIHCISASCASGVPRCATTQEPNSSWVRLTVDGQPVSVLQYTLRFLGSSHDSVRTLAAENVAVFLSGQHPASLQALLPLLYKHLEADVSLAIICGNLLSLAFIKCISAVTPLCNKIYNV